MIRSTKHSLKFSNSLKKKNLSIFLKEYQRVGQDNLEEIVNINFRKATSRKMQAWTNTSIRDKVIKKAEELGVLIVLQNSTYKSQRCSKCGYTRKANRKAKFYECNNCNNFIDADLNAAINNSLVLPDVSHLRGQKLNLNNVFFWMPNGLFNHDGQELRVPGLSQKNIKSYDLI